MSSTYPELPMSRSALDKLGKRIAASDHIGDEDLAGLQRVITTYDDLLAVVKPRVDQVVEEARHTLRLDLATPTSRPKTVGTIHDKLRREVGMGLKGMQDLAGIRVVGTMNRREQDRVCDLIEAEFVAEGARTRRIDRRQSPSFGYRAVHLVVFPGGMPVEIQVRTEGQQLWANLYEGLADRWGRAIRYGGEPDDPGVPVGPGVEITRREMVELLQEIADDLDDIEQSTIEIEEVENELYGMAASGLTADGDAARDYFEGVLLDAKARYDRAHSAILKTLESLTMWAESW